MKKKEYLYHLSQTSVGLLSVITIISMIKAPDARDL